MPPCYGSLLPYQQRWVKDHSRWKFGLMSRQSGKDFSAAYEGVSDIIFGHSERRVRDWLIVAPSERQSLEALKKWHEAYQEFQKQGANEYQLTIVREGRGGEQLLKSATLSLHGGSRVIAVPGKPETVRGYSANVLLTEFAFFENPDATWRAILPSVTNPLRGGEKLVRLITTPNGIGNKAHDIWAKNFIPPHPGGADATSNARWSCHMVDIHTAVREGLPVDINELREAIDDPDGWAQEYECQFVDTQAVLLPYDLIAACESETAGMTAPGDFWNTSHAAPIELGIDFGRKHDLTVCWAMQRVGDVAHTVEVLGLDKLSTPDQVELLRPRIQRAQKVCLDYTGPGIGMGDFLVKEFGEWRPEAHQFGKVELCVFSQNLKVDIFSKLRMAFEQRAVRIPINRAVREDLHSVHRVTSETGGITYRAPRGLGGHADRCTALALAIRAGAVQPPSGEIYVFDTKLTRRAMTPRASTSQFQ